MDSPGPTTELSAAAEPTPAARATPLATNTVRAMVANNTMVRLIKRPPLSVEGRRKKGVRPPPRYVTKAPYSCLRAMYVLQSSVCSRAPMKRTNFSYRAGLLMSQRLHRLHPPGVSCEALEERGLFPVGRK